MVIERAVVSKQRLAHVTFFWMAMEECDVKFHFGLAAQNVLASDDWARFFRVILFLNSHPLWNRVSQKFNLRVGQIIHLGFRQVN